MRLFQPRTKHSYSRRVSRLCTCITPVLRCTRHSVSFSNVATLTHPGRVEAPCNTKPGWAYPTHPCTGSRRGIALPGWQWCCPRGQTGLHWDPRIRGQSTAPPAGREDKRQHTCEGSEGNTVPVLGSQDGQGTSEESWFGLHFSGVLTFVSLFCV